MEVNKLHDITAIGHGHEAALDKINRRGAVGASPCFGQNSGGAENVHHVGGQIRAGHNLDFRINRVFSLNIPVGQSVGTDSLWWSVVFDVFDHQLGLGLIRHGALRPHHQGGGHRHSRQYGNEPFMPEKYIIHIAHGYPGRR